MDLTLWIGRVEEEHHGRLVIDLALQFVARFNLDHSHAHVADRMVIADAMSSLHEHFVLQTGRIRDAADAILVAAGDARSSAQCKSRGTPRADHRRRALEQLGDSLADGVMELIQAYILARGYLN